MPSIRRRSWIHKFDAWGVLRGAFCFGRQALRSQRCRVLPIGLLLLGFGGLLLLPNGKRLPSEALLSSVPSNFTPVPVAFRELPQAKGAIVPESLVSSRVVHAGRDVWRFEIWSPRHEKEEIGVEEFIKFFKNDRLVRKSNALELHGVSLEFGKAAFKTRFPLLIVRAEPAAGHPGPVNLFSIRDGRLLAIGTVDGEAGGPIFRDYDGDGKKEWVFDDYNWYVYYGAHPRHYVVYKEGSDGKLKRWKRLPNKERRRLPANLGLDRWEL